MPDQKKGSFERLIAAGGGQVVSGRCVYDTIDEKQHTTYFQGTLYKCPRVDPYAHRV